MPESRVRGCPYVEEGGVSPVQVLHIVGNVAQDFDKEYGAFLVDIRQESQGVLEVFEPRWAIIARPLVDRVHEPKGYDKQGLTID